MARRVGPAPLTGPWAAVLLFPGCVVVIGLLDLAQQARRWPLLVTAVLDEPAHLLTAGLVLAALLPRRVRAAFAWALAGAVLIDVDHVPLYLWGVGTLDGHGRPITPSLMTVLVLACAAMVTRGRVRTALLGLALGVGLHLLRDIATGPGVPLWWPFGAHGVAVPYAAYLTTLVLAAAVAVGRRLRRHQVARGRSPERRR